MVRNKYQSPEVKMKFDFSIKFRWRSFLFFGFIGLILVGCASEAEDASLPEGCDGITWGSGIQVEEREGEYVALITGDYPDACSTVCGNEQTVDDNEINVNLFSSRPEDLVCAQVLTPFETEVLLDTEGLEPGEYTVTLNETHGMTTFTLE
jgi:hypothetical protein